MSIGRPDWAVAGKSEVGANIMDVSELAARLGSSINYDRVGKLLFQDNFERLDSMWVFTNVGAIGAPALVNTYAEYGSNSLYTQLGIGAANYIQGVRALRGWNSGLLSLEIGIYTSQIPVNFYLTLQSRQNNIDWTGSLRLQGATRSLYYVDSVGTYRLLKTYAVHPFTNLMWSTLKIDLDLTNKINLRAGLNDDRFTLANEPIYQIASAGYNRVQITFQCYGNAAALQNVYVDRMLVMYE